MADEPDDRQLLAAYAGRREQGAFARLVRRHVPFVYACALRQTRDPATAEDITQTVFNLLALKAHALSSRRGSLRGWLFGVTGYAAANERRAAVRRRRHERRAARSEAWEPEERPPNVSAVSELLDGALAKLSPADREAVLLRYFEGADASAVAAALGVSEQAARRRLSRAVERMRKYFAAAGVTASSAAVSAALASPAEPPADLARKVLSSATAPSADRLATAAAVARAMAVHAVSVAAAWVLVAVGCLAGAALVVHAGAGMFFPPRAPAVAPPVLPRRPVLTLTLAWNGQALPVSMPATFPEEVRRTDEYRRWESSGGARTFAWATRDGRTYRCRADERDAAGGRRVASISSVQLYGPDGALLTETICDDQGAPRQWTVFAPGGTTKLARYDSCAPGTPGGPFVQSVRVYDPGGTVREYLADRNGTIYAEWLLDAGGKRVRLLNGSS
jgi:RNA polymerase sigma factor (sigma-70 family)